jgi:hypothetical protein
MMAAVRDYVRPTESPKPSIKMGLSSQKTRSSQPQLQTEREYEQQIIALLAAEDYDGLELAARDARTSRARIVGGVWQLYDFYDALCRPPLEQHVSEADWNDYVEIIKRWNSARPESATARIVLAGTYAGFAWFARGGDYGNKVSRTGWKLFGERFELVKATLLEAARLKDKCPYWFELVQTTALAEGWDRSLVKETLDKAIAFEPTYYHFYREYANYLQPKWYGRRGETQRFGEQIANRLGGDDGDIIYFEIAGVVACQCQSQKTPLEDLSWPRIQLGYIALRQRYGISSLKLNRYALMAYSSDDKVAANQAFAEIGEDWDHDVWKNQKTFEDAKAWAASQ